MRKDSLCAVKRKPRLANAFALEGSQAVRAVSPVCSVRACAAGHFSQQRQAPDSLPRGDDTALSNRLAGLRLPEEPSASRWSISRWEISAPGYTSIRT